MRKLNNSFLWGIVFASGTWTISLYLYWILNVSGSNHSNQVEPKPLHYSPVDTHIKDIIKNNDKSIATLQHKDLLLDDVPLNNVHEKFANNVWKYHKQKYELSDKVNMKERFLKQFEGKKYGDTDKELVGQWGLIKNEEDVRIREKGFNLHAFNCLVSQRIGNHRAIPDTRNKLCDKQNYPENLPAASVVICFYNEHFETLMRSIHSILERTDKKYLKEIVLVDDFSDIENLHNSVQDAVKELNKELQNEMQMLETNNLDGEGVIADYINDDGVPTQKTNYKGLTVKLFRTTKREGLIRARLFGAERSTGDVLVFLDSHIEVNVDWLRPLLYQLSFGLTPEAKYSQRAVAPIIDVINPDTFDYTPSPLVRGGFNWGLHFKWDNLPKGTLQDDEDYVKPIKSPTMAGGLFAIYREYFNYIGKYDPGMDIWGGENLEISFRIWMCGGTLELVPCSRVGHVFRKRRPYGLNEKEDYMLKNSMRMARVWMDEYLGKVIEYNPSAAHADYGDISDRVELRKSLNCTSFKWYMTHVYPELEAGVSDNVNKRIASLNDPEKNKFQPWHSRKRNYTDSYQIRLTKSSLCVQAAKDIKTKGGGLVLAKCIRTLNQMWFETNIEELVLGRMLCLDASNNMMLVLGKCHELGGSQKWKHKGSAGSPIYNTAAGMCLGVERAYRGEPLQMVICDSQNTNKWDFIRS